MKYHIEKKTFQLTSLFSSYQIQIPYLSKSFSRTKNEKSIVSSSNFSVERLDHSYLPLNNTALEIMITAISL